MHMISSAMRQQQEVNKLQSGGNAAFHHCGTNTLQGGAGVEDITHHGGWVAYMAAKGSDAKK